MVNRLFSVHTLHVLMFSIVLFSVSCTSALDVLVQQKNLIQEKQKLLLEQKPFNDLLQATPSQVLTPQQQQRNTEITNRVEAINKELAAITQSTLRDIMQKRKAKVMSMQTKAVNAKDKK